MLSGRFPLLLSALLALAPSGVATAQERPEFKLNLPPYGLSMWSYVYPSGLRVLIQQDESAPMTAIATVVDHGATSDPVGKEGTAMMTEYLWFQTRHGGGPRVQDRLYAVGATHHADTKPDFTYYFTAGPQEATLELVTLEAQRLTAATAGLTPELVTAARELVRNDFRFGGADDIETALPYLYGQVFPEGNPYHRIGNADASLDTISLPDLEAWSKEHYRPEATTIMIVSALDPEEVKDALYWSFEPTLFHPRLTKEHVKRYLSSDYTGDEKDLDLTNPAHWSMRPVDPDHPEEQLPTDGTLPSHVSTDGQPPDPDPKAVADMPYIEAPVDRPTAILAWSLPAAFRGKDYLGQVLSGVVEGSFLTYYRENPGVEKDATTGEPLIDCRTRGMAESSILVCSFVILKNSVPESIVDRAIDQVALLWDPAMRATMEQRFYPGRNNAMADLLVGMDDYTDPEGGRAGTTVKNTHFSGKANVQQETMSSIMSTAANDVAMFALDWLDRKRAVRVLLQPMSNEARLGMLNRGAGYAGDMLEGRLQAGTTVPTAEQVAAAFHAPDLSKIQEKTLSNGMRVIALPHGDAPLVLATVMVGGGRTTGDVGLDDAVHNMIYESPHPSATDAENAVQLVNIAGLRSKNRSSTTTWHAIKASAGNTDAVLYSLRRQLDLRMPAAELKAAYIRKERDKLEARWANPTSWADAAQWATMAPGHPLGRSQTWEGLDTLAALGTASIGSYLADKFRPSNATLIIVGDIDPAEVIKQAESYLGSWKGGSAKSGPFGTIEPPQASSGPSTWLLDVPSSHAVIDVSCQLTPWTPETYADHGLLAEVLDERFDRALLDQRLLVLQSEVVAQTYASGLGLLQFYAVVDPNVVGKTLDTIESLTADASAGTFDPAVLGTYRLRTAQTYGLRYQSLEAMRDTLIEALENEGSFSWFDHLRQGVADADAASLKAAFGTCSANLATTVRGDASALAPQLEAAGWTAQTLDWKAKRAELMQTHDPKAWKKLQKK